MALDITEAQAGELLEGLCLRYNQDGISNEQKEIIKELGCSLSRKFEKDFDWKHHGGKSKKVFEFMISKKMKVRVRK